MKTAEVFCKNYAIEKKFVAFVVDCIYSKSAEVYSLKYEIATQRHTTEECYAVEKKAHMKKLKKYEKAWIKVIFKCNLAWNYRQ